MKLICRFQTFLLLILFWSVILSAEGDPDYLGYPVYQKQDVQSVKFEKTVKKNEPAEKKTRYGVTINKLSVARKEWDPFNKNSRKRLRGFMNRSKNLSEKEMLKKWIDFVEKDLHMGFLNNALVRGVILAPVGFVVDQVTRLKKTLNVKSKFERGNIYIYKGSKF